MLAYLAAVCRSCNRGVSRQALLNGIVPLPAATLAADEVRTNDT